MAQEPTPQGLPPAYESAQHSPGYGADGGATSLASERAGLLQNNNYNDRNSSDTDISSLLESDDEGSTAAVRRELEEMEIMEPQQAGQSFPARASMASLRIAHSLSTKIISPVQRMLDPIATFMHTLNIKFDAFIARYGNPLILKRLLYLFFVFFLIFVAFQAGVLPGSAKDAFVGGGEYPDPETLVDFLKDSIRPEEIKEHLEYLSSMPHFAGTAGDLTLAKYIREELKSFGMNQVGLTENSAYITYPNETESSIQLQLLGDNPFTASMKEDLMYEHPTESQAQPKPFHGFSASGEVQGPLVYVNYGTKLDFELLENKGISITGCIAIMRNGKMNTGLKVKLAELAGAIGVVTFSDRSISRPGMWPEGPDYPAGAVERDSLAISAMVPGDLLSPGYSSIDTARVVDDIHLTNIPTIPAVPVSWKDVTPFLAAIEGYGVEMLGSDVPKIDSWWSGNTSSPKAKLTNYPVLKKRHPIWNVLGKLDGQDQSDLAIIIGAKRDSWCYGAVGPMSGTAVLLEVARIFTLMSTKLGWKPLRTIYFASWDGSDQNLAGTTEWVEYNIETLRAKGAVYINLDDAVSGDNLEIKGHPMLQTVMKHVLEAVTDPISNHTLGTDWSAESMKPFDEPGDHLPFLSYAGIPSIQMSFRGDRYPKNSCFDSFEWMKKFGDPNFDYHSTLTDIVSKLIIRLADDPILPFDIGSYGDAVDVYLKDLERYAKAQPTWEDHGAKLLDFKILHEGAYRIRELFKLFMAFRTDWITVTSTTGEPPGFTHMRWAWNSRMVNLDKIILDEKGLIPQRPWFKHPIFGPQLWHPTEGDYLWGTFPGIRDMIEKGDWVSANDLIGNTGVKLVYAASHVHG